MNAQYTQIYLQVSAGRLFMLLLAIFTPAVNARSQSNQYVVCDGSKAWFVDGAVTASIGTCDAVWVSALKIDNSRADGKKRISHERKVLSVLQHASRKTLKPTALAETKIGSIINANAKTEEVVIAPKSLPPNLLEVFDLIEGPGPTMQFIISGGTWFIDQGTYTETDRYAIRVNGDDPTLAEILEAAKNRLPGPFIVDYRPYLFLQLPWKEGKLDLFSRASDYKLVDGSTLWIKSSVR